MLLGAGWKVRSRVAEDWTYVGSDGFYYLGTAEELRVAKRYAMRLPQWSPERDTPAPLTYCRVPGPSIVMSLVAPKLPVHGYEPWYARVKILHRVMDLATCGLVFALGLALFGWGAAWLAYAMAIFHPLLALYAASMFSETFATLMTTATLLLIGVAVSRQFSPRRFAGLLYAGALLAGLATLVRIDSLILMAPLVCAPLLRKQTWRARIGQILAAAFIFGLVLSPWMVRNYRRFGFPYLGAAVCDTRGQPVERQAFMRWIGTWLTREEQLPTTQWCFLRRECQPSIYGFPPEAFASFDERRTVEELLNLRRQEGMSERVDQGFAKLADARIAARPFRTRIGLPIERAKRLWLSPNDLPLRGTDHLPWPEMTQKIMPKLSQILFTVEALGLLGLLFCLALPNFVGMRRAALLIALLLLLRTAVLAYTGATEGRYLLEVLPLLLVLTGAALTAPFRT